MIDQLKPSAPPSDAAPNARAQAGKANGFDAAMIFALLGGTEADAQADSAAASATSEGSDDPATLAAADTSGDTGADSGTTRELPGFALLTGAPAGAVPPSPGRPEALADAAAATGAAGAAPGALASTASTSAAAAPSLVAPAGKAGAQVLAGSASPVAHASVTAAAMSATAATPAARATPATPAPPASVLGRGPSAPTSADAATAARSKTASTKASPHAGAALDAASKTASPTLPAAAAAAAAAQAAQKVATDETPAATAPGVASEEPSEVTGLQPASAKPARDRQTSATAKTAARVQLAADPTQGTAALQRAGATHSDPYDIRDTLDFAARRGGIDATTLATNPAGVTHALGVNAASQVQTPVPAAPLPLVVSAPLQSAQFAPAFSAQIESLVMQGVQSAEITLNPRELGPVKVELSMSGETMEIAFSAAQPETRQAIEQSLPTLRAMLSEQGLTLSQASVGQGAFNQSGDRRDASNPPATTAQAQGAASGGARDDADAGTGGSAPRARGTGLVDLFA